MHDFIYFLKRKYESYLRFVGQAKKGTVLGVMMVSLTITLGLTLVSIPMTKADVTKQSEVYYTESREVNYAEIGNLIVTREETTTEQKQPLPSLQRQRKK